MQHNDIIRQIVKKAFWGVVISAPLTYHLLHTQPEKRFQNAVILTGTSLLLTYMLLPSQK